MTISLLKHGLEEVQFFLITENHVGYKLGEFAPTRTFKGHKGSVQKKIGK